ncbi:hypothetical protein O3M35_000227 [Rhynocoris fuscipes]|uniref:Pre-C2HC domain-containing protein n=1 Tax=Rhynocoris fuscipes TaxID=488301 RepID=A0AAW1DKY6_9HEMI
MGLSDTDIFCSTEDESDISSVTRSSKRTSGFISPNKKKRKTKKKCTDDSQPSTSYQINTNTTATKQSQSLPQQRDNLSQHQQGHQQSLNQQIPQPTETIYTSKFATHNKYNLLPEVCDPPNPTILSTTKSPPIYVYKINNYIQFVNQLKSVIDQNSFTCKARPQNILISTNQSDDYRKVVHFLQQNHTEYHTYQMKEEKAFRVVFRNLHHTIPTEDIKQELIELGFRVRNVSNIKHPELKTPLPLFFIDLEPDSSKNQEIFKIRHILNCIIKVEEPYRTKEIVQCKRCQQYGHTRGYCHVAPRCVKCAGPHFWEQCNKSTETSATCALCNGNHPANYRGCETHKNLQRIRREREQARGVLQPTRRQPPPPPLTSYPDIQQQDNRRNASAQSQQQQTTQQSAQPERARRSAPSFADVTSCRDCGSDLSDSSSSYHVHHWIRRFALMLLSSGP